MSQFVFHYDADDTELSGFFFNPHVQFNLTNSEVLIVLYTPLVFTRNYG